MKKSYFFTALVLLPLILFVSCADHVEDHGRDLTVKLQVEYTVPADAEIIEGNTFTVIDYVYNRDLIKIAANSDVIVRGTVEKVANTYVVENSDGKTERRFPYSAINFKIGECLKGDLRKDDKITILQQGSYMPLGDYIKYCGNSEREIQKLLYSFSEEEIENTFYHITPVDEAPAEDGEECIYFLTCKSDDSLLSGAYRLTRGAASVLHCSPDGTLTRYPSDSVLDPANDSIEYEKFSSESVITAISKSENYVIREKYQAEGN